MDPARIAIIEDEPPAREIAQEFLARLDGVEVVAECGTCAQALATLPTLRPDVVLLDVQLPDGNGFDVLAALPYRPSVVFATAYEGFALQAFDAAAADYLVKPYKEARFREAIERAVARAQAERDGPVGGDGALAGRLLLHVGSRAVAVDVADIVWAEAQGDYTRLHTADGAFTCGLGIGALEERLGRDVFLRIHRSTLVAVAATDVVQSDGAGGYLVTLSSGHTVRASRSRAAALRESIIR